MRKMTSGKLNIKANAMITEKKIKKDNYGSFKKCRITFSGKKIEFIMQGGTSYLVPIRYFLLWYDKPHFIFVKGRWKKWNPKIGKKLDSRNAVFRKWRRISSGTAVCVYLSNKTSFIVPWDTVLMACEPRYEFFGGLTQESQKIVWEYFERRNKKPKTRSKLRKVVLMADKGSSKKDS